MIEPQRTKTMDELWRNFVAASVMIIVVLAIGGLIGYFFAMVTRSLALDDAMLDRLASAAELLPVAARDNFMRSVANRIGDLHHPPGMADLEVAIEFVLSHHIGGGRAAFSNVKNDRVVRRIRAERSFSRSFR